MKVVVIGGGWAGCSAAYFAKKAGAEVALIERTDLLLGTGLVGGIMRNNGRLAAAEEARVLAGDDFSRIIDSVTRHRNVNFPGHRHADLYDVTRIERAVKNALEQSGVQIYLKTLISSVLVQGTRIFSVSDQGGNEFPGDVFIDTTGTAGPMKNCIKYGTGCAMCILRCPTFGPRISVTAKAGIKEIQAGDGLSQFEAISGSCKLAKESLDKTIVQELNKKGVVIIPLPEQYHKHDILRKKACQQYALEEYATNLILLDTGHAKLMTPFFPLESLRSIDGFHEAKYADPYSGGQGNSVRFMAMAPCQPSLQVEGLENLFCAGEKIGPVVGHTEAIITGMLAGHNAVRKAKNMPLIVLPGELVIGDFIAFVLEHMKNAGGLKYKFTFSGSVYFERMQKLGFYPVERETIRRKIEDLGLTNVFSKFL